MDSALQPNLCHFCMTVYDSTNLDVPLGDKIVSLTGDLRQIGCVIPGPMLPLSLPTAWDAPSTGATSQALLLLSTIGSGSQAEADLILSLGNGFTGTPT
eukprot:m.104697 g.104697  ORF g.104697 m.104697 type:complete len:99 (-) comp15256_c0_seq4:160-456(-)